MTSKQRGIRFVPCVAAIGLIACAGQDPTPDDPDIAAAALWVSAQPLGHTFEEPVSVRLLSERPSRMYYTRDGSPPTGENAIEYTEPLDIDGDVLLMFVAVDAAGVWSKPQSELYRKSNVITHDKELARALWYDSNLLFFAPKPGIDFVEQQFVVESTGVERVRIPRVSIGPNKEAPSFFHPDAFEIVTPFDDVVLLAPGETMTLTIRYYSTETIRSSALIIESDDLRARDGAHTIALWGRVEP